jgi:cytochrome c oxidase cbb3-type subunit III
MRHSVIWLARRARALLSVLAVSAPSLQCQVERVPLQTVIVGSSDAPGPILTSIQAGPRREQASARNPFEGNAYALEQGERYYNWFNCSGCHGAIGGGAMGPPLADAEWIYGGEPLNVLDSIRRGRPNGMPSFGGAISDDVAWQVVAYVRSLGGVEAEEPLSTAGSTPDSSEDPEKGVGKRGTE